MPHRVLLKKYHLEPAKINNIVSAIADFSEGNEPFEGFGLNKVHEYSWPKKGPSLDDLVSKLSPEIKLAGRNNYQKNVDLKKKLSNSYKTNRLDDRQLAEWIIKDWGGIKTITTKLDSYLVKVRYDQLPDSLSSVASYSKLYAMFYPEKYAIYDARVAVSLNIIQLLARKPHALFFPYLPGRNKKTGDAINKRGFKFVPQFSRRSLLKNEEQDWFAVPNGQVYPIYNEFLHAVKDRLGCALADLEMILFAQAEDLVDSIAKNQKYSNIDWASYIHHRGTK